MFVIKLTYIAKKFVFNYSIINFVGPFLVLSVRETGKKVFSKKKVYVKIITIILFQSYRTHAQGIVMTSEARDCNGH